MTARELAISSDHGAAHTISARDAARPIAALALALPIAACAILLSIQWVGKSFPGFFLLNNGVVPTVSAFAWPRDRNAVFHTEVVEVDGRPVSSSMEVYDHIASRPAGTPIEYVFRDPDTQLHKSIPTRRFGTADYAQTYGIMLFFGVAWLAFGIVVGFLQPHRASARIFLFQSLVAGLYPITGVFLYQGDWEWMSRFYFALECLFPATWIHLATVFPVERELRGRLLALPAIAYTISAICLLYVLRGLSADPVDLRPLHVTYLYAGASFGLFLINLAVQFRSHRDMLVRSRIKAVLPGAMAAGALAFFALTDNALSTRAFPVQFGLAFTPLFSIGVAYSIAKHDLFDVDRVVRATVIYFLLTITLITSYAVIVSVAPRLVATSGLSSLRQFLFLGLAFAFDPLRRMIQAIVDRTFYRTRLHSERTIKDLSEAMTSLLDVGAIVDRLTKVVSDEMQLESTSVCLLDNAHGSTRQWARRAGRPLSATSNVSSAGTLISALRPSRTDYRPSAIVDAIDDPAAAATVEDLLLHARANLVVPIVFRNDVLGALVLGPRLSGRNFGSDDLSLLRTLANQAAVALNNAQSFEAIEDLSRNLDAKVHQQTAELQTSNTELRTAYAQLKSAQSQLLQSEKLASLGRLVAGVAHELNNPASFIHGGLANLDRYLTRLTRVLDAYRAHAPNDEHAVAEIAKIQQEAGLDYVLRETPKLLRICAEGSERIKKIIDDLRVFAYADQAESTPTNVADGIDATLRILGDRISQQKVEIVTQFEDVPPVPGKPGRLEQVWMNLLANALDALRDTPTPVLKIAVRRRETAPELESQGGEPSSDNRARGGPWVEIVVTDNGSGISEEHRGQVFEPFFTTKPIGSGTGLGLAIAYGAVRSHAGRISVSSQPSCGTTFIVHLPTTNA